MFFDTIIRKENKLHELRLEEVRLKILQITNSGPTDIN